MGKSKLSTLIYCGIAICITIMLILFAGTLSGDEKETDSAPVTDLLFMPESVVKLTQENEILRKSAEESEENFENAAVELDSAKQSLDTFNKLSEAAYLIGQNDFDGAKEILNNLEITKMDENARILYEMIYKQIR